jgi:hypothetical protein
VKDLLIKVPESEFKALLDRDGVVAAIKEHLRPWTGLVNDITSYGTNLIPRCFNSSGRKLEDVMLLAVLLRQVVAMIDGVDILLSNGAVHAANLQMRALFEASVYIDWILLGDSEKKAVYYYVHNLRRRRQWAMLAQPGTKQSQDFTEMLNKVGMPIGDNVRDSAQSRIKDIDRILSQPTFAAVSADFEKRREKKAFDPAWYVPLGERSLRTMSKKVDKAALYVFLYGGASEVMHASSYEHHVKFGLGEVTFEPIRSVEGFGNVFHFTLAVTISTFRRILREYRPEELGTFARKYVEKWQKEFMNFPKIEVRRETSRI